MVDGRLIRRQASPMPMRDTAPRSSWLTLIPLLPLGTLVAYGLIYAATPSTAYPLHGFVGVIALAFLLGGALVALIVGDVDSASAAPVAVPVVAPILFLLAYAFVWVGSMEAFRAADYAAMAGPVGTSDWTRDVQPKDPRHMLLVSRETAVYEARKGLSQDGAIGSQFSLSTGHLTLEERNGHMVYEVPLDFVGYAAWSDKGVTPGWIEVDAEDPDRAPHLVRASAEHPIRYTPGAWFGHDLVRAIRDAGHGDDVASVRFDVDDDGRAWWAVTTTRPLHGWSGDVVTALLLVDPSSGEVRSFAPAEAPSFVGVVYPAAVVEQYLDYQGTYAGGWLNAVWYGADVVKPEEPILVAGNQGHPTWVTGMTSSNSHDDSLVSLVYTDPRTGRSVRYLTSGGATEGAAVKAADHNPEVARRNLHAAIPQTYNVDGVQTAVMPMMNANDAYSGVALAPLQTVQDVSYGTDMQSALDDYRSVLMRKGQSVSVTTSAEVVPVDGVVDRIAPVPGSNRQYLLHLEGSGHIFVASSADAVSLGLTQKGDHVSFRTVPSGSSVWTVAGFANRDLPLDAPSATAPDAVPMREAPPPFPEVPGR